MSEQFVMTMFFCFMVILFIWALYLFKKQNKEFEAGFDEMMKRNEVFFDNLLKQQEMFDRIAARKEEQKKRQQEQEQGQEILACCDLKVNGKVVKKGETYISRQYDVIEKRASK